MDEELKLISIISRIVKINSNADAQSIKTLIAINNSSQQVHVEILSEAMRNGHFIATIDI